uniref:Uridine 5'-monophosphate synthase n=1 Tax=Bursaphelenchus xylophilus TaxID=6326 RepID=A0A1I7SBI6_BURXY
MFRIGSRREERILWGDGLSDIRMDSFIQQLYDLGVFKLGDFVLKSGYKSPIYIDLRDLISSKSLMKSATEQLCELIKEKNLDYDYIVGVPYAALPLGTLVSFFTEKPMLLKRKEAKAYGTKKLIEGKYEAGKKALIVEDVISTGASIMETVETLRKEGLICEDVICVLDREMGGIEKLEKQGIKAHSVSKVEIILDYLVKVNRISPEERLNIDDALKNPVLANPPRQIDWKLSSRLEILRKNKFNAKIVELMLKKHSNLCVAVDLPTSKEVLETVEKIKEHVVAVKLHADTINDFGQDLVKELKKLAENSEFVLFEDRKFADTGNTNELQLANGSPAISEWAHLVTAHAVAGKPSIEALRTVLQNPSTKTNGVLLVAQLSCEGALTSLPGYTESSIKIAEELRDTVAGFICQKRVVEDESFLYWTPGVNLSAKSDGKGQNWRGIEEAIFDQGNDVIIVGRGITKAADPAAEAQKYAQAGWAALQKRE